MCNKDSSWNPRKCICENGKHVKVLLMNQQLCVMKL